VSRVSTSFVERENCAILFVTKFIFTKSLFRFMCHSPIIEAEIFQ
jgi:hypothetical protein